MKIYLFVSICCLFNISFTNQEIFTQATNLYNAHEEDKALVLYESIKNPGKAVWYNRGNVFFKLKRYPEALASWHHALRYATIPEWLLIVHNIACAQTILGIQQPNTWQLYMRVQQYLSFFSILGLQLLVISLWYVSLFLLIFIRSWRRWSFVLVIIINVIGLAWLGLRYQWLHGRRAVIVKSPATMRIGPGFNYHKCNEVPIGELVDVKQQELGWLQIIASNGKGWLEASHLVDV